MSLMKNAKEFFGFAPYTPEEETYYDEPRYNNEGSQEDGQDRGYAYDRGERAEYTPEIVSVSPRSYDDAKQVGEPFREGDAVVMDLTDMDRAEMRKMIDFSAGLCFALRGDMVNVAKNTDSRRKVFAIVPESARVTISELERAAGLH